MPYKIVKRGDKYAVVKEASPGKPQETVGTHDSNIKANRQIQALYVEEGRRERRSSK